MAAKFFTGLPLDGPDPECVHGHGEAALACAGHARPQSVIGHSKVRRDGTPVPVPAPGAVPHARLPRPRRRTRAARSAPPGPRWRRPGARAVLAVPLGSLEQHGPHLPLDTDTRIAVALAAGLADGVAGVVRWRRAVAYGASGEHAGFAGHARSSGTRSLAACWSSSSAPLVRSFRGVVLVNAHGGNEEALAAVEAQCGAEGDEVLVWSAGVPGGDAHAGRTETSLMLAIDPARCALDLAEPGCTEPIERLLPASARRRGAAGIVQRRVGRPERCERRGGPALCCRRLVVATWPLP